MTKDYILVNYKPFAFIRKVLDFLERDKIFSKKDNASKNDCAFLWKLFSSNKKRFFFAENH